MPRFVEEDRSDSDDEPYVPSPREILQTKEEEELAIKEYKPLLSKFNNVMANCDTFQKRNSDLEKEIVQMRGSYDESRESNDKFQECNAHWYKELNRMRDYNIDLIRQNEARRIEIDRFNADREAVHNRTFLASFKKMEAEVESCRAESAELKRELEHANRMIDDYADEKRLMEDNESVLDSQVDDLQSEVDRLKAAGFSIDGGQKRKAKELLQTTMAYTEERAESTNASSKIPEGVYLQLCKKLKEVHDVVAFDPKDEEEREDQEMQEAIAASRITGAVAASDDDDSGNETDPDIFV